MQDTYYIELKVVLKSGKEITESFRAPEADEQCEENMEKIASAIADMFANNETDWVTIEKNGGINLVFNKSAVEYVRTIVLLDF